MNSRIRDPLELRYESLARGLAGVLGVQVALRLELVGANGVENVRRSPAERLGHDVSRLRDAAPAWQDAYIVYFGIVYFSGTSGISSDRIGVGSMFGLPGTSPSPRRAYSAPSSGPSTAAAFS